MTIIQRARAEIRPLVTLTVPIVAGFACSTLITVVDTVMIAPLGTVPLAAVSLTSSALMLFYSAIYGLLTASGIRISEKLGAKAADDVRSALLAGLVLAVIAGIAGATAMALLFLIIPHVGAPDKVLTAMGPYWMLMAVTLLPWAVSIVLIGALNAEGRPWLGFIVATVQLGANVPLNWVLIYGVGMGLQGAGLASLLATLASIPFALMLLRRIMRDRHVAGTSLRSELAVQWRVGWPMAVAFTGEGGGFAIAGLMLAGLGAVALAANQIVHAVMEVLYMLPLGLAMATSLQISFARGENASIRLRPILLAAIVIVMVWMVPILILVIAGGAGIASFLSEDAEVVSLAASLFVILALMQMFDGVQSASMGALRGMSDTHWPMIMTLICYWLVALPAAWALGFWADLGATGVWMGYSTGVFLAAILLPWRFRQRTRS